jgi:hypothetical protein
VSPHGKKLGGAATRSIGGGLPSAAHASCDPSRQALQVALEPATHGAADAGDEAGEAMIADATTPAIRMALISRRSLRSRFHPGRSWSRGVRSCR